MRKEVIENNAKTLDLKCASHAKEQCPLK